MDRGNWRSRPADQESSARFPPASRQEPLRERSTAFLPTHQNPVTLARGPTRQTFIIDSGRPMRLRFPPAMLLAVLFSSVAMAAGTGVIRGVVHDAQHRPIAGATVVVRNQSSNWSQTTQSDSQ